MMRHLLTFTLMLEALDCTGALRKRLSRRTSLSTCTYVFWPIVPVDVNGIIVRRRLCNFYSQERLPWGGEEIDELLPVTAPQTSGEVC
jgi:hypothetical protein